MQERHLHQALDEDDSMNLQNKSDYIAGALKAKLKGPDNQARTLVTLR